MLKKVHHSNRTMETLENRLERVLKCVLLSDVLDGKSIGKIESINCQLNQMIVTSKEIVYKRLCDTVGFKQRATRTRGRKSFKQLYVTNLCVECREPGRFVIGHWILGPSNDHRLCQVCIDRVMKMTTWTERKLHALPRAKMRLGTRHIGFDDLLHSIPYKKKKTGRKRRRQNN